MNKKDLHDFKANEPFMQAMIPGIHNINSVGSSPLKRGNTKEKHEFIQQQILREHSLPDIKVINSHHDLGGLASQKQLLF